MPNLIFKSLLFVCLTLAAAPAAAQEKPQAKPSAAEAVPRQLGGFRAEKAPSDPLFYDAKANPNFLVASASRHAYAAPNGERYLVTLVRADTYAGAYSLLRHAGEQRPVPYRFRMVKGLGVTGASAQSVKFIKGTTLVHVAGASDAARTEPGLLAFAGQLAGALEGEPGDVPPLVLHLPEWERQHETLQPTGVGYAVRLPVLQALVGDRGQPVLEVIDFEGGAEAATARYEAGRLVVVEFPTPQHSVDADAAINARINELRAAGQPVPAVYRREGNYSVFVFDAPDAAAAEQLAAGVKYEKDVRWLGRNPHADEIVARQYTSAMGGAIITAVITTGLGIALCLLVGGGIGTVIFMRRRARIAEQEVYSDAGGMLRLNLEELNAPPAGAGLLRRGED